MRLTIKDVYDNGLSALSSFVLLVVLRRKRLNDDGT
jgi:hypothetical protein